MALYWTFRSLPELNHLDEQQRHRLLRTHAGVGAYMRLIRISLFYALVLAGVCGLFTGSFMNGTAAFMAAALTAIFGFLLVYQFCMRIIRADLRLTMIKGFRGDRLPVCLGCGYDLTGADGDRCPECGKGIVVRPVK